MDAKEYEKLAQELITAWDEWIRTSDGAHSNSQKFEVFRRALMKARDQELVQSYGGPRLGDIVLRHRHSGAKVLRIWGTGEMVFSPTAEGLALACYHAYESHLNSEEKGPASQLLKVVYE